MKELDGIAFLGNLLDQRLADIWMSVGLTVILLILMGILYGNLRVFLR